MFSTSDCDGIQFVFIRCFFLFFWLDRYFKYTDNSSWSCDPRYSLMVSLDSLKANRLATNWLTNSETPFETFGCSYWEMKIIDNLSYQRRHFQCLLLEMRRCQMSDSRHCRTSSCLLLSIATGMKIWTVRAHHPQAHHHFTSTSNPRIGSWGYRSGTHSQ